MGVEKTTIGSTPIRTAIAIKHPINRIIFDVSKTLPIYLKPVDFDVVKAFKMLQEDAEETINDVFKKGTTSNVQLFL